MDSLAEHLKTLAAPGYFPGSHSVDMPYFKEDEAMGCHLDLSMNPPYIIQEPHDKNKGCWGRPMTDKDVTEAIGYYAENPPHPPEVTADDVINWLTTDEENLLATHARKLTHQLFTRNTPIPWDTFVATISFLAKSGLITAERLEQILRMEVVE